MGLYLDLNNSGPEKNSEDGFESPCVIFKTEYATEKKGIWPTDLYFEVQINICIAPVWEHIKELTFCVVGFLCVLNNGRVLSIKYMQVEFRE